MSCLELKQKEVKIIKKKPSSHRNTESVNNVTQTLVLSQTFVGVSYDSQMK